MKKLLILILALAAVSCAKPKFECNNSNPVFDKEQPQDKAYRDALTALLETRRHEFSYIVEKYVPGQVEDGLQVKIVGDSLCAVGLFDVPKPHPKLESMKKTKKALKNYNKGAVLYNFSFYIDNGNLVFDDVEGVIEK